MNEDLDISPEMIADIESALPDFIVLPDAMAPWWFEMAHGACHTLGLTELHKQHCLDPQYGDPDIIEKTAESAENLLTALRAWLREHGVPRLAFAFTSVSGGGSWFFAEIKGTESGKFTDEEDEG